MNTKAQESTIDEGGTKEAMAINDISMYKLSAAPDSVAYVENFVTVDEEAQLLAAVYAAPKPRWTCLSNRRLQNWGGSPHPKGMVPEDLPDWLLRLADRVQACGAFAADCRPNHVLVNEYLPGQGIMPHHDGPLYLPTVATVSLGSHTLLDFYSPLAEAEAEASDFESRRIGSVLLRPRSLVVVSGEMYTRYLHGIREVSEDRLQAELLFNADSAPPEQPPLQRSTRVSLTIRRVPKVVRNLNISRLLGKR